MDYLSVFCKTFNKQCANILRVWTKTQFIGNFETIFESFSKYFLRKLLKMHYLSIFFQRFNKPALIFRAFGRKTKGVGKFWENFENFWWKFNRKFEFFYFLFFQKFVTKTRAFRNNTIFLQHFFGLCGGGGISPIPPPLARPLHWNFLFLLFFDFTNIKVQFKISFLGVWRFNLNRFFPWNLSNIK